MLANLDVHLHKCSFFCCCCQLCCTFFAFSVLSQQQKKKAGLVLHSYTHAKKKKRCVGAFFYICQTSDLSVGQPILSSLFFSSTFFLCVLSILRRFYSTTQDNTCTYFRPDFLKEATLCLYSLSQLVISKYTTAIVFSLLFFFSFSLSLS